VNNEHVFWVRLYLTIVATVCTAIAAGAVTFDVIGATPNHDLQSVSTLIALGCNTALTGMATMRHENDESPPPPPSSNHPSDGQG